MKIAPARILPSNNPATKQRDHGPAVLNHWIAQPKSSPCMFSLH